MDAPDSQKDSVRPPSHMFGSSAPSGFSALPRPETRFNRALLRVSARRARRHLVLNDLRPWVTDSVETFARLGAMAAALEKVQQSFERHWRMVDAAAPRNVWFGEVVFGRDAEPRVFIYTDSPWSRTPQRLFRIGTQAAVDHIVAHLLEYHSGSDYGEGAACRDQCRLMLERRGWQYKASAITTVIIHRLHKQIPLRTYSPALREHYDRKRS